jgi:hypothetical protein
MPTLVPSLEQIVDTVRKLPKKDRQYVLSRILTAASDTPKGQQALQRFRRLRNQFRLKPEQERSLSDLLARANEGTLGDQEQRELDALLHESQERTLELALAVLGSSAPSTSHGKWQK